MKFVVAIALTVIIASISMCGYKFYKIYDKFPEGARVDNLHARYASLISELAQAIERSESAYSLASELEKIHYPDDTLSVTMQDDSDNELSILNRLEPNNDVDANLQTRLIANNGGYGQKNGQHFWILQYPLDKYEYDHIELLFERATPESE